LNRKPESLPGGAQAAVVLLEQEGAAFLIHRKGKGGGETAFWLNPHGLGFFNLEKERRSSWGSV
jgi:hypothetical protein